MLSLSTFLQRNVQDLRNIQGIASAEKGLLYEETCLGR